MVPGVGCVVLSDLLEVVVLSVENVLGEVVLVDCLAVVLSVENVEGEVVLVDGLAVVLAVVLSEASVESVS